MESKDMSILRLMELLQEKSTQSQREVSKTLGLSLGMVNKLINELTTQGLLKSDKIVRNKTRYVLTSKGMAKKMVLTKHLVSHYLACFMKLKQFVEEGIGQIKGHPDKNILLYGAFELCEIASVISGPFDDKQMFIIDDQKAGTKIGGLSVLNESQIAHMDYAAVLIMDTDNTHQSRNTLIGKGVPSEKIFDILMQGEMADICN